MKKVLHVWRYYGTRTQRWLYRMLQAMQHHTPWLLLHKHWPVPTEGGEFPWPRERLVFFPRHNLLVRFASKLLPALRSGTVNVLGTLDARFIRSLCRNEGFNLIHIHFGWTACTFLTPPTNLGARVLVSFYGKDLFVRPKGHAKRLQKLLRQPNLHFHVTSHALEAAALELGVRPNRITVIPVGVDLSVFPASEEVSALRISRYDPPYLRLVSVGRLIECRAQDRLAEVGRLLADRGLEFLWTIVGDGPLRPILERRILELDVARHFALLGSLPFDKVLPVLRESDILVLNAVIDRQGDHESLGVNLMEAGACGLPVVSCRLGGIPEVVRDGETGILVESGNLPAMAEAIERLARNPELRYRMGMTAVNHVRANFDSCKLAARIEDLYERLESASL